MAPVTAPVAAPVTAPVGAQANAYVERLLRLLNERGELGNISIREEFGLKSRRRLRDTYIDPALIGGLIEQTLPDKPTSRLQKYRLTAAGEELLREGMYVR